MRAGGERGRERGDLDSFGLGNLVCGGVTLMKISNRGGGERFRVKVRNPTFRHTVFEETVRHPVGAL